MQELQKLSLCLKQDDQEIFMSKTSSEQVGNSNI